MTASRGVGRGKVERSRFAENLRTLRGEQSQTDFASALLVSQQTLSFWENGSRRPNPRTWLVLEQRLGYTRQQLEGEELPPPGSRRGVEGSAVGQSVALPPLRGADALCIQLGEGLASERVSRVEIQRILRQALRDGAPVWLVVGNRPKGGKP